MEKLIQPTGDAETILLKRRIHWGIFLVPAMFLAILTLPLLVELLFLRIVLRFFGLPGLPIFVWLPSLIVVIPGLVLFWLVWMAYEDTEYFLTTKRLAFRTGWLLTAKGELPLQNVEAVFLVEPIFGRLFGYGTVTVTGTGGTPFALRFMPEPHRFHHELQQTLEAIRSGRPVRIAPDPSEAPTPQVRPTHAPPTAPRRPDPYEEKTPMEKAWEQLNRPPTAPEEDDARFRPKN